MRLRIVSLLSLMALVMVLAQPMYAGDVATTGTTYTAENSGSLQKVKIGNVTVEIQVTNGSAYIIVTDGGPLKLTYADGSPMCSLANGQGIAASGFIGNLASLKVAADGSLAMGPAVNLTVGVGNGQNKNSVDFTTYDANGNATTTSVAAGAQAGQPLNAKLTTPGAGGSLGTGQIQKLGDTGAYEVGNADGTVSMFNPNSTALTIKGGDGVTYTIPGNSVSPINGGSVKVNDDGTLSLTGGSFTHVTGTQSGTGTPPTQQSYTFVTPPSTSGPTDLTTFMLLQGAGNSNLTSNAAVSLSAFQ
ncbi:MAG: hypothetical protein ACREJ2_14680 [Planctomycetota bacterium]